MLLTVIGALLSLTLNESGGACLGARTHAAGVPTAGGVRVREGWLATPTRARVQRGGLRPRVAGAKGITRLPSFSFFYSS
jgi:hypothetical protein